MKVNAGLKLSRRELQDELERTQKALAQLAASAVVDLDRLEKQLQATREFMADVSVRVDVLEGKR